MGVFSEDSHMFSSCTHIHLFDMNSSIIHFSLANQGKQIKNKIVVSFFLTYTLIRGIT